MSKNKNSFVISVFECNVCKRSFDRKCSLILHSRIHLDDNSVTCKFCKKKFPYKYLLNKHLIAEGPEKCTGKTNRKLTNEMSADKLFECKVCKRPFNKNSSLIMHERSHFDGGPLTCKICQKTFIDKSSMNKHLTGAEGYEKCTGTSNLPFSINKDRNNFVLGTVVCPKTTSIINNKDTDRELNEEMSSDKGFECNVCKKLFDRKSSLILHERTHLDDRPLTCKLCQETFLDKSLLNKHLITEGPEKCTGKTNRKFTNEMSADKLFECKVCKRPFNKNSSLIMHERSHLDGRPLTCKICRKSFIDKSSMNKHLTGAEGYEKCTGTSDLPFSISKDRNNFVLGTVVCPKTTSIINNKNTDRELNEEMSSDKGFECNVCKKLFDRKSSLILHERTHLDDRPLTCKLCQETFLDKSLLNKHLITLGHAECMENDKSLCTENYRKLINEYKPELTSDSSFKCFICLETFKEECALKDHLYLHIGNCKKSFVQGNGQMSEYKTPDIIIVPLCNLQEKFNPLQDKNNTEVQLNCTQKDTEINSCHELTKLGIPLSEISCLPKEDSSKYALSDKLFLIDKDKSFQCEICKEVFRCENLLSEHVCSKAKSFKSEIAIIRRKLQHENWLKKPLRASPSGKKFSYLKKKSFVCCKCHEVFEEKSSLELHFCTSQKNTVMKTYNRASTALKSDVSKRIDGQNAPISDGQFLDVQQFMCTFCKQHFHNEKTLTFHLRCHMEAKFVCEDCQTAFDTKVLLSSHRRSIRRKEFQCNVCEKLFCYERSLINHYEIHNRKNEFHCDLCDGLFKNKFILNVHYFSHTKNVPFFICPVCLEIFSNRNNWIYHRCTHMGIKPHICKICKNYFIKRRHFYLHCRIHTDEVPYSCETCHKAFKYHNTLIMHQRNHVRGNT